MNSPNKRITLKDIADQCGYSVNTVSRALRNDSKLSEATISRIHQIADDLGYMKKRSCIFPAFRSYNSDCSYCWWYPKSALFRYYSQITVKLRKYGYHTLILGSYIEKNYADYSLSLALSYNVSGIVFFPRKYNKMPSTLSIRIIYLSYWLTVKCRNVRQTLFRCDDYQGGYIAGKHLLELGHRHFLYLPGPKYNLSQTRRYAGIMDALSEANVPASNIREIDYHTVFGSSAESTSSYKPYEELFFPVNYTAVIGFNDLQSYSAMEILQKKGYRIPEDISLISFDHLRKTHTYLPPLTSIADNSEKVLLIQQSPYFLIKSGIHPVRFPVKFYLYLFSMTILLEPIKRNLCSIPLSNLNHCNDSLFKNRMRKIFHILFLLYL